jgi:peptidoglycan/LPS O-acetylase OafA/YrhL
MAGQTKHCILLDGMRGVAAVAVVAYHFGGRANLPDLFPRAYAVDFFFVLSGFVLAGAYGERLRVSLTTSNFVVRRLIRLLPILVPGATIGLLIECWRPNVGNPFDHFIAALGAAILGCLVIPWPFHTSMEQTLFPINGPLWSLFFELLANLAFVAVARAAFPQAAALRIMVASGIAMIGCSLIWGTFDVGALVINWPGGAPRTFYSFFAGVIVCANRNRFPTVAAWIPSVVLVALFCAPLSHSDFDWLFDLMIIAVGFPMIVGVASHSAVAPRCVPACRLLGDISYPLYAIHYPIIRAICFVVDRFALSAAERLGIAAISIVAIMGLSWGVFAFYDRPVRQFLTQRLLSSGRTYDEPSGPRPSAV